MHRMTAASRGLLAAALAVCVEHCTTAAQPDTRSASPPAAVTKLGLYDYFTDESSPVIFNGKLLMMESIVQASPQWAGNWLPAFANCSCYYRVRDMATGAVIVNIT